MIFEFVFNSIIITFLYANIYIVYNFYKCLDFLIMLLILKFSFHYFFNIRNDLILFSISKMLILKKSLFIFTNILFIIFIFKLNLYFIFKKPLILLISIVIIIFIFSLFINVIIFFLLIFS